MPIFVQCHSDRVPSSMKCRQPQQGLLVCKLSDQLHVSPVEKGAANPHLPIRLGNSPSHDIKRWFMLRKCTTETVGGASPINRDPKRLAPPSTPFLHHNCTPFLHEPKRYTGICQFTMNSAIPQKEVSYWTCRSWR